MSAGKKYTRLMKNQTSSPQKDDEGNDQGVTSRGPLNASE